MVIAMLSRLLDVVVLKKVFSYHPKFSRVQLTHLAFADDLLIFTKSTLESVIGVQKVLDLFYLFSVLQINSSKCEIFSIGINRRELDQIHSQTGLLWESCLLDI